MDYRVLKPLESGRYIYKASISKDELAVLPGKGYTLLVKNLAGRHYKLYINGLLLGERGSTGERTTHMWNYIDSYSLDKQLIEDKNELRLEVIGDYELGLTYYPVVITSNRYGYKIYSWHHHLINGIYYIAIGALLFSAGLLFVISFISEKYTRIYHIYTLASLFMVVYIIDFLPFEDLLIPPLLYNKLVFSSIYFATFLISYALYHHLEERVALIAGLLSVIAPLYFFIFADSYLLLKEGNEFLNLLILVNILVWIFVSWKKYYDSIYSRALFYHSLLLFLLTFVDVYHNNRVTYLGVELAVLGVIVFLLNTIILLIYEISILKYRIDEQKLKAKMFYHQSIRDDMTGIYNHQYIVDYLEKIDYPYTLLLFDIDNFKKINDNYGHLTGDKVIIAVAEALKNNIRDTEKAGRYGGDEFVLVIPGNSQEYITKIISEIKKDISRIKVSEDNKHKVTVSMGIYMVKKNEDCNQALTRADRAQYYSKKNGKNRVSFYGDIINSGSRHKYLKG